MALSPRRENGERRPVLSKWGTTTPRGLGAPPAPSNLDATAPQPRNNSGGVEIADIAGQIMDTDSPLMRRADAKGRAYANSRGLLNSSMGAEASQAATLDYVVPMAQTERTERGTDRRFDKQLSFDREQADLNRKHEFEVNEKKFGYDKALQLDRLNWESGENALDRDHAFSLQKSQQTWQSGENVLDRTLQRDLQTGDQSFTAEQNALDRGLQTTLQSRDQSFTARQAELDRTFTGTENQKDRDNSLDLARAEHTFRMNLSDREYEQALGLTKQEFANALKLTDIEFQNTLGLSKEEFRQRLDVLGREQGFAATEAERQRAFEQELQSQGFDFTRIESALDRQNSVDLARMEQQFRLNLSEQEYLQTLGLSKEEFRQAVEMTDIEFRNALGMTKVEFGNALDILAREQGFQSGEAEKDRQFASDQAAADFDRQKFLTEMEIMSRADLALLDADTRKDLMQMEDNLRTKIAQMELSDKQLQNVGEMMVNFHGQYQEAFRSILNNPDLDQETRNSLMRSMGDMLNNQLDGITTLYGVDVGWNEDGNFDPVSGNRDPNAPAEETIQSASNLPTRDEARAEWGMTRSQNDEDDYESFDAYLARVYGQENVAAINNNTPKKWYE